MWLFEPALFLIFVIAIQWLLRRFFNRFKLKWDWLQRFDKAFSTPFNILLWLLFAAFAIDLVKERFDVKEVFFDSVQFRNAAIIFCGTWFFIRWKVLFKQTLLHAGKKGLDPTSIEVLGKIYTITVLSIATLLLLQTFGLNIAPLLAFGGIGAAVFGLASKGIISNFYGGMSIYLSRPFHVNDWVELPEKKLNGTIEKIGWYYTTLRDTAKKPFYIPNSIFISELLVNQSRITHRYINEVLSLRYSDANKLERLIQEIRQILLSHPDIDQKEPVYVNLLAFAESTIQLEIRAYTRTTRYQEFMDIKQTIMIRICALIENSGAGMGYPIREVRLQTNNPN